MAAMIAFQISAGGIIAQIAAAGVTGEPVLLIYSCGLEIGQGQTFGAGGIGRNT